MTCGAHASGTAEGGQVLLSGMNGRGSVAGAANASGPAGARQVHLPGMSGRVSVAEAGTVSGTVWEGPIR